MMPKIDTSKLETRIGSPNYPPAYKPACAGRHKTPLGNAVGLSQFGVNLTRLEPGAASALRHWHLRQDEFVWVLEGQVTLVTDDGEQVLGPGTCAGFPGGTPNGHHLVNRTSKPAVFLEIGDRLPGAGAEYPDHDLQVRATPVGWRYRHKDGTPYE